MPNHPIVFIQGPYIDLSKNCSSCASSGTYPAFEEGQYTGEYRQHHLRRKKANRNGSWGTANQSSRRRCRRSTGSDCSKWPPQPPFDCAMMMQNPHEEVEVALLLPYVRGWQSLAVHSTLTVHADYHRWLTEAPILCPRSRNLPFLILLTPTILTAP